MGKALLLLQVTLLAIFVKAQWPCPEASDIAPCVCDFPDGINLDLDCSSVTDDAALANVFQAVFPFDKFRYFNIVGTADSLVPIQHFNVDIFGNIYFQYVNIKYTTLATMDGDPFSKSTNLLETMDMSRNQLILYPFDTLQDYTQLKRLILANNKLIHMADIISGTLDYLNVNNNPELKYGDEAFYNAIGLRTLYLRNIGLTNIAANTFRYLTSLVTLDLSFNDVHILRNGSFWFESQILRRITMDFNTLDTIEEDAIGFCAVGDSLVCDPYDGATVPNIIMKNNSLTDLPKAVWEEAFMLNSPSGVLDPDVFDFAGNPIRCGCNIAWLVTDANHFARVTETSTCDNGDTFAELDPGFFEAMCRSPSTVPSV